MNLRRDIFSAEEENWEHRRFVSVQSLKAILTPQAVEAGLKARGDRPTPDLVQTIVSKASKLYASLVLIEQENYISYLLADGLDDDRFPVSEDDAPEFAISKLREEFCRAQWRFSVVLKKEKHLDLPGDVPLPFLDEKPAGFGAFGVVTKITISPGHLQGHNSCYVAMKTIRPKKGQPWGTVMREVETLRKREHSNIVTLLASFTVEEFASEEKSLRILFPWADMNMAEWLVLNASPLKGISKREDQRKWLYDEIYALVSAVSYLHRNIDGMVTSHHDLKPENILWLEGSLKICDFGRSHILALTEGSETEGENGLGSFTYQPPEYHNDDSSRSSRKHGRAFDVWSLGCIIVEMAILIVHGWESQMVKGFTRARESGTGRRRDFSYKRNPDDSFHNNMEVVKRFIFRLKECESSMLVQTLGVAEKMLAWNPDERIYSWEAELDLYEILHPDDHSIARMEKAGLCVQRPGKENDTHAQTPLHRAALTGNRERVSKLLDSGWPGDALDSQGFTPLQLAIRGGYAAVAELLANRKNMDTSAAADIRHTVYSLQNFQYPSHETNQDSPLLKLSTQGIGMKELELETVIELGQVDQVRDIIKKFRDPSTLFLIRDKNGSTLLHRAAMAGHYEIVNFLLGSDAGQRLIRERDNRGKTPLHNASERGASEIVHTLLRRDGNLPSLVSLQDNGGKTPLHLAAQGGYANVLENLLGLEGDIIRIVNLKDGDGNTPLRLAVLNGRELVAEILKEVGGEMG